MNQGDITIEPFNLENLKPGSYTFTLGSRLRKLKAKEYIDTRTKKQEYEEIDLGENGYLLDPGEFIVGFTQEKIVLGKNIACLLTARGSRAQSGLSVLHSDLFIEPESNGAMALAISNVSNMPIRLLPGIKIVKGIFFNL